MGASGRARVLVTVKATPQPSKTYGDTVCVAGLRVDGDKPEWIRLYPVPFRWLDNEGHFHTHPIVTDRDAAIVKQRDG